MAMFAESLGVPKEHIFREDKAEHGIENIYYSFRKAKALGFKRVALATDPFQARILSGLIRRHFQGKLGLLPADLRIVKDLEKRVPEPLIDPSSAVDPNFVSLLERENFWKRLRGTFGGNVEVTNWPPDGQNE